VPPEPPTATLRIGFATGQIHRDARAGSPTTFTAIYGVAPAGAATVTVRWPDGGTASVRATGGRFFLVWSGSVRPVSVTARSAGGRSLGTVRPA